MAVILTESQNTKCYLVATTVATSTAVEVETAIAGGKEIKFLPDLGDIGTSKNVTSYNFINTNEVAKSIGSLTLPNFACDLIYDATDTAGQADIKAMYADNSRRKMIIALNDNGGANPTYITFEVAISALNTSITRDNAVMAKSTIELCSVPVIIPAA